MSNYQVALRVTPAERKQSFIQHHLVERDETYEPKFSLNILIDDYAQSTFSPEDKQLIKTDACLLDNAVTNIVMMAKDTYEYESLWQARLDENYDLADKLMVDLQSVIKLRLCQTDAAMIDIFDTDPTDDMLNAFMDGMDAHDDLDRAMYEDQEKRRKRLIDGKSELELEGERDGIALFERWLTEPARVEKERAALQQERLEQFGPDDDYLRGHDLMFSRGLSEYHFEESSKLRRQHVEEARKRYHDPIFIVKEEGQSQEDFEETIRQHMARDTPEAKEERKNKTHENVNAKKEETKVNTTTASTSSTTTNSQYTRPTNQTFGSTGGYRSTTTAQKDRKPGVDEGFIDYSALPDGDQLDVGTETVEALPDGVYRAMEFEEDQPQTRSRIDRMKQTRKENPKLGKTAGESMQKGIAIGRTFTLPDKEEVKRARVSFKKRPFHFLKHRISEFYRSHRKPMRVMFKMSAFVAVQLGVNMMAGRFELKEDRHFVQMVVLTMMSFYLTQSLNKEGMPVGDRAFVM